MARRASAPYHHPLAPGPGRRERRRIVTRERIFRAALKLFAQRGFVATTIENITEAADVGKGTFFNYFPSKEHVLAAFGQMQLGKVAAIAFTLDASQKPIRVILQQMVSALTEEPSRSPALVRAILATNLMSTPVRRLMLVNLKHGLELLSRLFAAAQKQNQVRSDMDPVRLARAMHQMFFGTLILWALDPSEALQERLDRALELFWCGVSASGKETDQ